MPVMWFPVYCTPMAIGNGTLYFQHTVMLYTYFQGEEFLALPLEFSWMCVRNCLQTLSHSNVGQICAGLFLATDVDAWVISHRRCVVRLLTRSLGWLIDWLNLKSRHIQSNQTAFQVHCRHMIETVQQGQWCMPCSWLFTACRTSYSKSDIIY